MAIPIAALIAGALELLAFGQKILASGRTEIEESELDDALSRVQDSDDALSAAIARAEAREAE